MAYQGVESAWGSIPQDSRGFQGPSYDTGCLATTSGQWIHQWWPKRAQKWGLLIQNHLLQITWSLHKLRSKKNLTIFCRRIFGIVLLHDWYNFLVFVLFYTFAQKIHASTLVCDKQFLLLLFSVCQLLPQEHTSENCLKQVLARIFFFNRHWTRKDSQ